MFAEWHRVDDVDGKQKFFFLLRKALKEDFENP